MQWTHAQPPHKLVTWTMTTMDQPGASTNAGLNAITTRMLSVIQRGRCPRRSWARRTFSRQLIAWFDIGSRATCINKSSRQDSDTDSCIDSGTEDDRPQDKPDHRGNLVVHLAVSFLISYNYIIMIHFCIKYIFINQRASFLFDNPLDLILIAAWHSRTLSIHSYDINCVPQLDKIN